MMEAVRMLFLNDSTLVSPFGGDDFLGLPDLSNFPSESIYAGLNFSLPPAESLIRNNEFGVVS